MKVKDMFWLVACGAAALFAYDRYQSGPEVVMQVEEAPTLRTAAAAAAVAGVEDRSWIKQRDTPVSAIALSSGPKCDGRTRCRQMSSCAEATYFIRHCPNTAMDGDRDGIPCEDQWCR